MKKREAQKEKRDAEKLLEAVYGFAKVTVDKEEDSKQADEATVQQAVQESAVATDKSSKSKHRFWQTQPVPETSRAAAQEDADFEGPIETKDLSEVREEPLKLPPAFVWDSLDLSQESQLEELYALLNRAFLRWALQAPGYRPEWHVAVRIKKTGKLCAFIAAIPCRGAAHDSEFNSVEINFLCVHKKLRAQRLAPVLIKEITRRVNLTDCWQALYTAGVVIPRPVGTAQYFHRLLSPKKLLEVGFSHKPARLTMKAFCRLYSAPSMEACKVPGLRAMTPRDVPQVHRLLNEHLSNFKLRTIFSEEEVSHWLLPRRNVVYSYVKTDDEGNVTDLTSFYSLPTTVLQSAAHKDIQAAYSFYHVAKTVPYADLLHDALALAGNEGFDVFNALTLLDNTEEVLRGQRFGPGDGKLNYYIYNWRCPQIEPNEIGLVML